MKIAWPIYFAAAVVVIVSFSIAYYLSEHEFLESVPAVSAKLKDPVTADRKFEDVVKSAQDAAVLVLVY